MRREVIVLVCDLCERGEPEVVVETHRVVVDSIARDAEACVECWQGVVEAFVPFAAAGRQPAKVTKTTKAFDWPGSSWKFSSHAMQRMGERKVSPEEVLRVVGDPEIRLPGKASDQEVWTRNGTKVVVVPERQVVVTVARRDEDV